MAFSKSLYKIYDDLPPIDWLYSSRSWKMFSALLLSLTDPFHPSFFQTRNVFIRSPCLFLLQWILSSSISFPFPFLPFLLHAVLFLFHVSAINYCLAVVETILPTFLSFIGAVDIWKGWPRRLIFFSPPFSYSTTFPVTVSHILIDCIILAYWLLYRATSCEALWNWFYYSIALTMRELQWDRFRMERHYFRGLRFLERFRSAYACKR